MKFPLKVEEFSASRNDVHFRRITCCAVSPGDGTRKLNLTRPILRAARALSVKYIERWAW